MRARLFINSLNIMKIFRILTIMAVALSLCACGAKQQSEGFRLKRGTNLSHWLSQNNEDRGEARRQHIQEDDFARLAELGFDHVRLPIDEVQFWDEEGNKLPEAWELLDFALDMARKYELRTIVDLHIIRAHYFNAVNEEDQAANILFTDEAAQQGLINLWYQLSDFLKDRSTDWVAYEFMNEPVAEDHEQWNDLVAKVHKALREREPNRTLVIGSNLWQSTGTFKYLRVPEGDPNIILSFHYYNPQLLTHYGAWWTPLAKYDGPITYPGVMVAQEDYDAASEELKPLLEPYLTEEWNREKIHAEMADAIAVAESYGLQLFCGEWGVYEPVDREIAYAWTRDMLSVFDEFNIAWTTWCYDADFGFWDQAAHDYKDRPLVDILMSGKGLEK